MEETKEKPRMWQLEVKNLPPINCPTKGRRCLGKFIQTRKDQEECVRCIYRK